MSISKPNNNEGAQRLREALWQLYNRPDRPMAWTDQGNLPWNDPDFSERMLREHLSESHEAASRTASERLKQVDWFWSKLNLQAGQHLLDVTCGPGLYATAFAQRGLSVTGVDFGPAAIAHARDLALTEGVADRCHFIEQDVRQVILPENRFDAALLIYGQLAVFPKADAQQLLQNIATSLKPGAKLCIELLNQDQVDKSNSTWWFTDNTGLWGETPFLHLGERFWDAATQMSLERFQTIDLETGQMTVIHLCDQTYSPTEMTAMMKQAGFAKVDVFYNWDKLSLYDAHEWVVYVAEK